MTLAGDFALEVSEAFILQKEDPLSVDTVRGGSLGGKRLEWVDFASIEEEASSQANLLADISWLKDNLDGSLFRVLHFLIDVGALSFRERSGFSGRPLLLLSPAAPVHRDDMGDDTASSAEQLW
jgi:hypothetical protein